MTLSRERIGDLGWRPGLATELATGLATWVGDRGWRLGWRPGRQI
jgi:hypothetical protein